MITKTYTPRPRDIERKWYVVDAEGAVLGRLASEVAKILRGKHKPMFAPHMDTGDHVIVVNAAGIRMTGSKAEQKVYYRHSGYPGGIREQPYGKLLVERPTLVVEKAIRGMLPKNRLGRQMISKLAVYAGPDHPHQAQKPEPLAVGAVPAWSGLPAPKPKPAPKADARAAKAAKAAKPGKGTRTGASGAAAAGASSGRTRRAQARPASRASAGAVRRGAGTKKGAESSSESKPRSARSKAEPSKES